MNKPIDRAIAKQEIERINDVLDSTLLLIGGLAVQQYSPARVSQDIDLVCSFDTAQEILDKLYPLRDWKITDHQHDDYRPSYRIKHKIEDKGTIIFGPKITERKPYDHIDWSYLSEYAKPFAARSNKVLQNILIPSPEALAYTKLISYLGRVDNRIKINQDLKDFVNLTNHDEFSSSRFYDLLRRSKNENDIFNDFRDKSGNNLDIVTQSSLYALSPLFNRVATTPTKNKQIKPTNKSNISVYIAAPHKNIPRNKMITDAIKCSNVSTIIPYDEVASQNLIEGVSDSVKIRTVCMEAIKKSQILIVDLDKYGLDTAWELGYAEGLGKRVVGYNEDEGATTNERFINRRTYDHNFMHGWQTQTITSSLDELATYCKEKTVYVCGAFSNDSVDSIHESKINETAKKVIYPKEYFDAQGKMPSDYPSAERAETNKLLKSADIVAVMLPRYGMDASWQIGYATALGKEIVGIVLSDDSKELDKASFWDHWMHGWKNKLRATGTSELCEILTGVIRTTRG